MSTEWRLKDCADAEPLHYTWCGLDDVYLRSGYHVDPETGDITIQHLDGLHRAIGDYLARHKKTFTGKEIRFLRHQMNASQRCLGKVLRVSDQTVARWEKDEVFIRGPEDLLLRLTYLAHIHGRIDVN